jgi:hypothetical protein
MLIGTYQFNDRNSGCRNAVLVFDERSALILDFLGQLAHLLYQEIFRSIEVYAFNGNVKVT